MLESGSHFENGGHVESGDTFLSWISYQLIQNYKTTKCKYYVFFFQFMSFQ